MRSGWKPQVCRPLFDENRRLETMPKWEAIYNKRFQTFPLTTIHKNFPNVAKTWLS
jgi:hypothetical protein